MDQPGNDDDAICNMMTILMMNKTQWSCTAPYDDNDDNDDNDNDEKGRPCAARKLWAGRPASPARKHPGQALLIIYKYIIYTVFWFGLITLSLLGNWLTCSGDGVRRLGPVEELQEGGDGHIELGEVLQLFENHLQEFSMLGWWKWSCRWWRRWGSPRLPWTPGSRWCRQLTWRHPRCQRVPWWKRRRRLRTGRTGVSRSNKSLENRTVVILVTVVCYQSRRKGPNPSQLFPNELQAAHDRPEYLNVI